MGDKKKERRGRKCAGNVEKERTRGGDESNERKKVMQRGEGFWKERSRDKNKREELAEEMRKKEGKEERDRWLW